MIRLIKNKNIDRDKWDRMILQKGNGRMYVLSGYLDAVANDWNALVYGDYDVVMPLPIRRNWFRQMQHDIPLFVQQIGIIGLENSNPELRDEFIIKASKLYRKFMHSFNHENGLIELDGFTSTNRTNYELDLSQSYEEISKRYSDNLIRNLKKAISLNLEFRSGAKFESLNNFVKRFSNSNDPSPKSTQTIKKISEIKTDRFSPDVYSIFDRSEILAICFAPSFQKRITLLIPRSSPEGREVNAMAFLIDSIIQHNASSEMILDFEGSMLPGVGQFYKSFGGADRKYSLLKRI